MVTAAQVERTVLAVGAAASVAMSERELLSSVARIVRGPVPYAAAAWLVTDPTTGLFTDGVIQHLDEETCTPWFTNEFMADDVHEFHDLVGRGAGVLSRTDDRRTSSRWSQIMRPQGLDDELRLTLDDRAGCWGTVELHRPAGEADFTAQEARLLELAAASCERPVGHPLRRSDTTGDGSMTTELAHVLGPGDGEHFHFLNHLFTTKVDGDRSNGTLTAMEFVAKLGTPSPTPTMPTPGPIDGAEVARVCALFDIEVLGPPLAPPE